MILGPVTFAFLSMLTACVCAFIAALPNREPASPVKWTAWSWFFFLLALLLGGYGYGHTLVVR